MLNTADAAPNPRSLGKRSTLVGHAPATTPALLRATISHDEGRRNHHRGGSESLPRRRGPVTYEQRVCAALLSTGGIASHLTAARLWGLVKAAPIEITVPMLANNRLLGVAVHRSDDVGRVQRVYGLPVTNPSRTFVQIANLVSDYALDQALEWLLRQRLGTFATIRSEITAMPRRNGVVIAGKLLDSHGALDDRARSGFERRTMRAIRSRGLIAPVREHPIVVEGINRFIDLCYPQFGIAIEVDSRGYHALLTAFEKDRERNSGICALDWILLAVTEKHFDADIDRIERVVRRKMQEAA